MKLEKRKDSQKILEVLGFDTLDEYQEKFEGVINLLKYGQASEEILRIILKRDRIKSMNDLEEHLSRANHFRKEENKNPLKF